MDREEKIVVGTILSGLLLLLTGAASCEYISDKALVEATRLKAAAPGYTGCEHHCGDRALQVEADK